MVDAANPALLVARGLAGDRPQVEVQGDAALANDVSWLIDNLRWEVSDDLARFVGPAAAQAIARVGRLLAQGLREALRLASNLAARRRSPGRAPDEVSRAARRHRFTCCASGSTSWRWRISAAPAARLARVIAVGRRLDAPRGVRLRMALEHLGPIFVKFGQVLSTRRDLLPPDIADELAQLQDRVPPFPARGRGRAGRARLRPPDRRACSPASSASRWPAPRSRRSTSRR